MQTHKNKHGPQNMKLPISQKNLFRVSGLHKVSLNRHKRGSVKVHFLASTPRTMGGWVGLHLYVLSPVFHPVNGVAITSGRRQQMVVSALNGLLEISTTTCWSSLNASKLPTNSKPKQNGCMLQAELISGTPQTHKNNNNNMNIHYSYKYSKYEYTTWYTTNL